MTIHGAGGITFGSLAIGAGLALFMTGSALAADLGGMKNPPMAPAKSDWEFSANVALTTDYVFRGASQTDESGAVQGGFDVGWKFLSFGVWASNLDFGGADSNADGIADSDVADIEIDWYAGFKKSLNGVELDLGVIYYHYPNAFDPGGDLDYIEFKAGLSGTLFRVVDAGLTVYYSPDYTGEIGDTYTVEGALETSLRHGFAISGTLAYIENTDGNAILADGDDAYWYWNAGLSKTFKETFTLDVRYWDTDGGSGCETATLFQCDARVVGTLSASF